MKLSDNKATLSFSNGSPNVELPVYHGSVGPDVIDIRKLYAQTGMFTYDPGFLSTASCQSAITYIDGDKGELLYRGYRSSSWPRNAISWRRATCCCTASCRTPKARRTSADG